MRLKFNGFMGIVLVAALMTGCHHDEDENSRAGGAADEGVQIETAGRLAIFDTVSSAVKMLNLDDGQQLGQFTISGEVPRLYTSPGSRYVAVVQRADNRVSFIDGGLYSEDHGDHMHDYAEMPSLLSITLNGAKPTHYTVEDQFGLFFNDAGDGVMSSVDVFSDASLTQGKSISSLALTNSMHGVAKMVGDQLFVTHRDALITDTTLPAEIERFKRADGKFEFIKRYTETCVNLHGADRNETHLAFGCGDGVLVIDLKNADFPAKKLGNPAGLAEKARIGTILGHHDVPNLVGVAGGQIYVIDPLSDSAYTEIVVPGGAKRLTQGFSLHGDVFYVLSDDGKMHFYSPRNAWAWRNSADLIAAVPAGATAPVVIASGANDVLYLLDPVGQSVLEIAAGTGVIQRTINLGYSASRMAWAGLTE